MARKPKSDTSKLEPPEGMEPGDPAQDGLQIEHSALRNYDPTQANLEGRGKYRRQLERFVALPDADKHKQLKDTWKEVAMVVSSRAKSFAATCSPKDFGRLYQLVMSGAVSIDKAFPKQERENSPALVVNMFGTLGQRAARIAMPETPHTITVEAKEVTEWPDSATTTTSLLPTATEKSPTTTPSTEPLITPSAP